MCYLLQLHSQLCYLMKDIEQVEFEVVVRQFAVLLQCIHCRIHDLSTLLPTLMTLWFGGDFLALQCRDKQVPASETLLKHLASEL